jgi:hypothetical protein
MSRRCSECRARFEPSATAAASQRVCGRECRKLRRARLARGRRRAELADSRADEAGRQRLHRERRRVVPEPASRPCRDQPLRACSGSGAVACHEPASRRKQRNLYEEMAQIVDSSIQLSRASFERAAARIEREFSRISVGAPSEFGQRRVGPGRVSRATFHVPSI